MTIASNSFSGEIIMLMFILLWSNDVRQQAGERKITEHSTFLTNYIEFEVVFYISFGSWILAENGLVVSNKQDVR